ncbi:unnamed protein product [Trichogramma brassicae]|uniref:Uncharacterized protein n=1 Tax=Trichogramma brassicae TaxID=86971 RepID=A0A6H5I0H4_9HYME|nr:unnamed protein product [Trichogramma brassicae]
MDGKHRWPRTRPNCGRNDPSKDLIIYLWLRLREPAQATNITTISLVDVGECDITTPEVEIDKISNAQLISKSTTTAWYT